MPWINRVFVIASSLLVISTAGCASSSTKILPEDAKTISQVYSEFSGSGSTQNIDMRARQLRMRDSIHQSTPDAFVTGFPPRQKRIEHLFPTLPNPELFMYVFPHAVGETGAPIPAYYTRFSMYEKNHYTLPGESIATVRRDVQANSMVREELEKERAENQADGSESPKAVHGKYQRLHRSRNWPNQKP